MSIDNDIEAIACALACLRRVGSNKDRPARRDPAVQATLATAMEKLSAAQSLLIRASMSPDELAKSASEASTMPIPVIKDGDVTKCPNCGESVAARFEHEDVKPYDGKGTQTFWKCEKKPITQTDEILTITHLKEAPRVFDAKKARQLAIHFRYHTGGVRFPDGEDQAQMDAAELLELAADAFDKLKALPLSAPLLKLVVDADTPAMAAKSGSMSVELSPSGNMTIRQHYAFSSYPPGDSLMLIQNADVKDLRACLEKLGMVVSESILLTDAETLSIQTVLEWAQAEGKLTAEEESRLSAAVDRVGK